MMMMMGRSDVLGPPDDAGVMLCHGCGAEGTVVYEVPHEEWCPGGCVRVGCDYHAEYAASPWLLTC